MFVFDTNILSAMMRPERASVVADWIDAQDERRLHTTAISQAEILAGLAAMPDGRRRRAMEAVAEAMFDAFDERVLAFDADAAAAYAGLYAQRRRSGRPASTQDLMIAAIARAARSS
jgi:predicted nucleic acid-binding protein